MLLPSSYEGFGLPLSEGLARGLPVVCSDIPPFMEQLERWDSRDRAEVFRSGDEVGLAAAMRRAIQQRPALLEPAEAERRMSRWTWAHAARLMAEKIGA
jgi:glycosyltransferase involved in cell wall biosynthesis